MWLLQEKPHSNKLLRKVSGESETIVQHPWNWLDIEPGDADSMTPGGTLWGVYKVGAFCARGDSDRFVELDVSRKSGWDLQCTPACGFLGGDRFGARPCRYVGYRDLNVR